MKVLISWYFPQMDQISGLAAWPHGIQDELEWELTKAIYTQEM